MHFSRKSRPREFNTTGDRIQRIDNITTFLHLAANKCSLCRSTCATLSFDHASVIPTDEISRFQRSCRFLHRTQYDVCFMFRVRVILKGLHRRQIFLLVNVHELCLSENDIARLGA